MKTASCQCGALSAKTRVEPAGIVACHCSGCQRRTGSVFGVGAYYLEADVEITGEATTFSRPTAIGNQFHEHFCPKCGTTLYWWSDKNPGLIGIAVGAFADPAFPKPQRSVWEQSCHDWVDMSVAQEHFDQGRP